MGFWQSVRFKIVFGFFLILAPLVLFLIYNNLYAMDVVRGQISSHYNKLLTVNVRENDKFLKEYKNYLTRLERNPDIPLLQSLRIIDSDYTLAKIRLLNQFTLDSSGIYYGLNSSLDSIFIYIRRNDDLYFATSDNTNYSDKQDALLKWSRENLSVSQDKDADYLNEDGWKSMEISGQHYLMMTRDLELQVYAGTLVKTASLLRVLENFDVGADGAAFLIDSTGKLLVDNSFAPLQDRQFRDKIVGMSGTYGKIKQNGQTYLVLSQPSMSADVNYVIVMTEKSLLQNLPIFQNLLYYWIPLVVAILLSVYLVFLQRIIFKPLVDLLRGMRKLGQGRFDIRLPLGRNRNSEFAFLTGTFNQMAEQIERLKIDVYEEQIRVQRAEYKHLQIQINPHFYMNSLNIIYNLAALKDYKSVQKLSLHLADYFRFLMQSNRAVVRLEDEIKHIGHYLEIQKIRYVNKLDYELHIRSEHQNCELSPLMIQPFVENSVIHGFNKRKQDGTMFLIRIVSEGDEEEPGRYVRIRIEDNGPGFPAEMLCDLESGLYVAQGGEQHLGIWNILRRFKMLYGDDGGISFANGPNGGAQVTVRLPMGRPNRMEAEEPYDPL